MSQAPFTHHEILGLVAPFSRRGRHVDLAATNRLERRLAFKPVERSGNGPKLAQLRETLQLENPAGETYRLTRVLTRKEGPCATLEAEGPDPAQLLQAVESISPDHQFQTGLGFEATWDYRLGRQGTLADAGCDAAVSLILTRAAATVAGMTLILNAPTVKGEPADIELQQEASEAMPLPPDLLAVLGRGWSPLRPADAGWRCKLRSVGAEPQRSRCFEREFERAVRHLARTLAEAPGRFHDRWAAARAWVFCRRFMPLLACGALIGAVAALPRVHLSQHSPLRMLIFNAPPLLMALFFCLREIPRIEIPPLPRRSKAAAWRGPQP